MLEVEPGGHGVWRIYSNQKSRGQHKTCLRSKKCVVIIRKPSEIALQQILNVNKKSQTVVVGIA